MASRYYSSVAAVTTLSNGVSPSGTSFIVGSTSGFPVQTPFTLLIDEGTTSEEIVTVTNVAGTTLTVTRGEDGTVAVAHDPGARVRHAMTARDLRESREHEAATANVHGVAGALAGATDLTAHTGASSGVHGVSGSVVGTTGAQTLTNKTLSSPTITGTVGGTTNLSSLTVADRGRFVLESSVADVNFTSGTFTAIDWVTGVTDTHGFRSTVTPSRIQFSVAGTFIVTATVSVRRPSPGTDNQWILRLRRNGASQISVLRDYSLKTEWTGNLTDMVTVAAGDYLEVEVFTNATAPYYRNSSSWTTRVSGVRVA